MIRGYFGGPGARLRPFVIASVSIPHLQIRGTVHFLVDTGADTTLLAPRDAKELGLDINSLPQSPPSMGVGGPTPTASTEATITLDSLSFTISLRILAPTDQRQQRSLQFIPSLLGRDIMAHFALFMEERTRRVLLLEPEEVGRLQIPVA
ncbi:MAG: Peptidase protein [Dehalococcoidia bacterium]|nr:Peptidase protein [Dehalococcoidia bacterium]